MYKTLYRIWKRQDVMTDHDLGSYISGYIKQYGALPYGPVSVRPKCPNCGDEVALKDAYFASGYLGHPSSAIFCNREHAVSYGTNLNLGVGLRLDWLGIDWSEIEEND